MKERKRGRLLWIGAAAVAVISLFIGGYFTLRKGVYVGNDFYYRVSGTRFAADKTAYVEILSEKSYRIVSPFGEKVVTLETDGDLLTFTFPDGEAFTGIWDGEYITDPDGFPLVWKNLEIQIVINDEPVQISNVAYCQALCRIYYGEYESLARWYYLAFGLLPYILGLLTIRYPNEAYFFLVKWRYRDPELSDAGKFAEQIGGGVLMIVGVAFMLGMPCFF